MPGPRAPRRSSPRRTRCALAALLAGLAAAAAPPARPASPALKEEVVFSDFDLAGWHRLGQLEIETSALDMGRVEDLLDGDLGTLARTAQVNPARFQVSFKQPRVVRRVVLRPGTPDSYAVSLSVTKADGGRFAAGELVVSDNDAVFRLRDVTVRSFELTVERLERDDFVHVAEIRVNGELTITALTLDDLPSTLPEGGSFPVRIIGSDGLGGRPDLTPIATLVVNPARAVALVDRRHAVTRVGGPLSLSARLGQLQGPTQPMLVQPLAAAPPAPEVRAAVDHVELTLEGRPPFEILRRGAGEKAARSWGTAHGRTFLDERVEPGAAYQYSVRRIDRFGNPLSRSSAEGRARTLPRRADQAVALGRFPVLVVLYEDSFTEPEIRDLLASLEAARLFLFRHSRGRMVVETEVLRLSGPTPSTAGPSMEGIEADLRHHGLPDDAFGAVFAVSNDMQGSFGNFPILGRSGGAMGRRAPVVTPDGALGPDPGFAWSFVHELWHALVERAAVAAGRTDVPGGHPAEDVARGLLGSATGRAFDAGEAWDAHAALLAGFSAWEQLGAPYRRPLTTLDSDGDGLPDEDPRLPMDELRFGSDPAATDSDSDGLDDLAELAAGLYAPSNPRRPDTDGDGLPDGADPWPLARFTGAIPFGAEPALVAAGPDPRRPEIELLAAWTPEALHLRVRAPRPADVFLDLDGSGALGRWESDTRVGESGSDVWAGPARIALRAVSAPRGVFVGGREVPEAALAASLDDDGRWRLDVTLPAALGPGATDAHVPADASRAPGLRLAAGRVLGLALSLRASRPDDAAPFEAFPAGEPWTGLFETHRLYDAVLQPPPENAAPVEAPAPAAEPPAEAEVPDDAEAPAEAAPPAEADPPAESDPP